MFTAKERVERDGFLIAYAGETMTDAEAARRGLIGGCAEADDADVLSVGAPAGEQVAIVEPPIDEAWAQAAGMSVDECIALWDESPNAVLDAIKENLAPAPDGDNAADDDKGADNGAADDGSDPADNGAADDSGNAADGKGADLVKPSREDLRKECEARGIKAPKNASAAQLQALLGD